MDDAARSGDGGRAALVAAYERARAAGDAELMARAALALPSGQRFGLHPGQIPALIHEAFQRATSPASRCRLAGALARAWVYGGDADRAVAFAREAVALADELGDPAITAEVLDAALVAHWGPDDFAERLTLAARLADTAAYLTDPAPRLTAHLWRLTTAWECLDVVAVQRQLRALDALAQETGSDRDRFFAASRRGMYALVTGDIASADRLIAEAVELGDRVGEPDAEAVRHSLVAQRALVAGDVGTLRSEAGEFEAYGAAEGVPSVSAEAAVLWFEAGEPERARRLLLQIAGAGFETVARDVDFLLTASSLLLVAAGLGEAGIVGEGVRLLTPFAGRAVLNAGAVTFHGVVDEYLYRGELALGREEAARWRHSATSGYQRLGAGWWRERLEALGDAALGGGGAVSGGALPGGAAHSGGANRTTTVHLHPDPDGGSGWLLGIDGSSFKLPDLKGLHYLRELLRRPGVDVSVLDLSAAAQGHADLVVIETDTGVVADAQALTAYRNRLREIDTELDEAGSWSDEGRLARLRAEREALLAEVRAATGLGGRRRRFTSAGERARTAVRKAIVAAIDRVTDHDAALGRLLVDTVRTGSACRYEPDPARPVTWVLEAGERDGDG